MGIKHGMFGTVEYVAYSNAKARCTVPHHPHWKDYGGRGIKFLFTSFELFYLELGPRPTGTTLDREDNDGNYEPGNVRWLARSEQQKNKRPFRRHKKVPANGSGTLIG